jgi:hypothetical protein
VIVTGLAFPHDCHERINHFVLMLRIFNGFILLLSGSNEVKQRSNLKDRRGIRKSKHLSGKWLL